MFLPKLRLSRLMFSLAATGLFIFVALAPGSWANKKELDTTAFNIKATVVNWKSDKVITGFHTPGNPNCMNPQDSFWKAYCAGAGTNSETRTRNEITLTILIGSTQYAVLGKTTLPPGDYQVRIIPGKHKSQLMEFLISDKNGKAKAVQYEIVGVTQLEQSRDTKPEKK